MIKPNAVLLIFLWDKMVLTGAKVCLFLFFLFHTLQLCTHDDTGLCATPYDLMLPHFRSVRKLAPCSS
jgi:hypothetical protein